jgi:hypothetical protein
MCQAPEGQGWSEDPVILNSFQVILKDFISLKGAAFSYACFGMLAKLQIRNLDSFPLAT